MNENTPQTTEYIFDFTERPYFSFEQLSDLLSILKNHAPHFLTLRYEGVAQGIDPELSISGANRVLEFTRYLAIEMKQSPSVIFFDLGSRAHNIAIDLTLGADYILAQKSAQLTFDHAKQEMSLTSGLLSQGAYRLEPLKCKQLLLSGGTCSAYQQPEYADFYYCDAKERQAWLHKTIGRLEQIPHTARAQIKKTYMQCEVLKNEKILALENALNQEWIAQHIKEKKAS